MFCHVRRTFGDIQHRNVRTVCHKYADKVYSLVVSGKKYLNINIQRTNRYATKYGNPKTNNFYKRPY